MCIFRYDDSSQERKPEPTGKTSRKLTNLSLTITENQLPSLSTGSTAGTMTSLDTPKVGAMTELPVPEYAAASTLAPQSLHYHHQLLESSRARAILRADRESQKSQYSAGGSSGSPGPTMLPVPR